MISPDEYVDGLLDAYDHRRARPADLLCDRHPADDIAFTIIEPDLSAQDLTYGELTELSARFAAGLAALGVGENDRVATLMGKSAELVIALLGIWRLGAVHVPLFTAFAPPAIALRTTGSGTKVIIADADQRAKLTEATDCRVVTVGGTGASGDVAFGALLEHPPLDTAATTGGDGTLIELFTSGTTGRPKAVPVPVRALAAFRMYAERGLDQRADDVFWNAADPGWAYGLFYAVLAPLAIGRRSLLLHAGFDAALTWRVLDTFGVTNFTAGPTVYRALRNSGIAPPDGLRLRCCSSAGEPLPPDVITWAQRELGLPIHDHYGQTEMGMAVGNAWHPSIRAALRPGSMGRQLPGFTVAVLRADADEVADPGERGRVAVDCTASPLMWFTGYRDAPERTRERFSPDRRWYYTGDVAAKDADGYLTFASRDDDVILMAGYRIGPFDVESALLAHEAVAEAAVIGAPDELRGEVVVAYVVPRPGEAATPEARDQLAAELQHLVKTRFAAHAYPRAVYFVDELPKTPSGKIQRFVLRQQAAADRV
ncbi:AMP-binding protein [Pseudonocardia acaciae]|uniref:AMP-binding protein n=1 Tax=Pseudonocardia acaciae TaxID=551276 RepID=UPI00048EBDF9|nr:AMP-binding protein [Pseudonocardia acaciae]